METYRILSINPGSTSTKIAVFDNNKKILSKTLRHDPQDLAKFDQLMDQLNFRTSLVKETLAENNIKQQSLDAVVGRGGLVRPVKSGIYKVNEKMFADLKDKSIWNRTHASNLGAFIADAIAKEANIPAYIADPVTVDEMDDIARISGVPEIERKSLFHALNIKSIARKTAAKLDKTLSETNLIACHMGGGISVAALKNGKVVDVNNALLGMGPFSPQRAGALPLSGIINLCYSGEYTKEELEIKLVKNSGLMGYLGTDDGIKIEKEIDKGNKDYEKILRALAYQVSKEIGLCATVLKGDVDAIFVTGGLANDKYLTRWIKERTKFLAPIYIFPGEGEMEALAEAGIRALTGEEQPKEYL